MKELLSITLFSMLMVYLTHIFSDYDPIECRYRRKERLFYTIMSIGLILFAGLRTYYNDTQTYILGYNQLKNRTDLPGGINWLKIGDNPGFIYVQYLLIKMGASSQTFLMVFSAFTVLVNLWFFRKYSCNIWLSILIFLTYAGYVFNLAAIKQCTAMAFCLIATDQAIQKKYIGFAVSLLLACLFHPYALMYIVVPFLFFKPWSKNTFVMMFIFALAGVCMQTLLGTLLNVTDMLGENYDANSFTGEGVNPIRLLVTSVPVILSIPVMYRLEADEQPDQYVIVNLAMLNAEIMFVALFGTANYFARLANYFLPFQAVAIPFLLKQYGQEEKRTMTTLAVIGYAAFFVYSQRIHEVFDDHYKYVKLWDYLQTLF